MEIYQKIPLEKSIQLTNFGPTSLVMIDMLQQHQLLNKIVFVFIDTFYHFDETYDHMKKVISAYPDLQLKIYQPKGFTSRTDFETFYGPTYWTVNPDHFGFLTKIEPKQRALIDHNASICINGRRKDQGESRSTVSMEEERDGIKYIQPLYDWTWKDVWDYINFYNIPYNILHDKGYKSIGDIGTTEPIGSSDPERSGRWKGTPKTECGLYTSI